MIGNDIIDKRRIAALWQKHGRRLAEKILHPDELAQLPAQKDPVRYLALRWAAKEALGKAFGTGLRTPLVMPAICLGKTPLGAPTITTTAAVETMKHTHGITKIHLSLSDERDYAVAFVCCEHGQPHAKNRLTN